MGAQYSQNYQNSKLSAVEKQKFQPWYKPAKISPVFERVE